MTQPRLAHQTPHGRMYSRSVSGLPEVPSITTVIGMEAMDLTGWAGHMASRAVVEDPRLVSAVQAGASKAQLNSIARDASDAAARYRDAAAERGDRVHDYAEQVGLRAMGKPHQVKEAREALAAHNESAFADRFDEWWEAFEVKPLATELTVWNHTLGYAGTLDLVASIGGRTCLIDYKTKTTDRNGRVKPLDDKVVMQLTAGFKAEEELVDAEQGEWQPWSYGDGQDTMMLAVALGETEVVAYQANPQVLPDYWRKFAALHHTWNKSREAESAGIALRPIGPPPAQ